MTNLKVAHVGFKSSWWLLNPLLATQMDLTLTQCISSFIGITGALSLSSLNLEEESGEWEVVRPYPSIPDCQQFFAGRTREVKKSVMKSHKLVLSSFILFCLLVMAGLDL